MQPKLSTQIQNSRKFKIETLDHLLAKVDPTVDLYIWTGGE